MPKNFEGFGFNSSAKSEVQMDDPLSFEELVDVADKAVEDLNEDNWKDAYNKVMKLVVFVEWEERFMEDDPEEVLQDLKSMLQGALASSERRGEEAA
jgi:hypothetical protein